MRISIDAAVMADAVAWAARSLPNRPSLPILAGLFIEADDSGVTLSTFDYERSAKILVPADVHDEGIALVSGKLLADISKSLPNKPVEITSDGSQVELVCGSARFTLQMLPIDEYPPLPAMPASSGTVDSDNFAKAISQVVVAAGRDELMAVFTGVRVEFEGETLSLLATDRYRMALKEITWTPSSADASGSALVPATVLNEAARTMASGEEINLAITDNEGIGEGLIGIEGHGSHGERQLTTRLVSGEFPKVRHLMDITPTVTVRTKTAELIAAVKRVALVAERNSPLKMLIGQDQISLDAATGDQAHGSEAIDAIVTNEQEGEMAINAAGFNPHYLTDALSALDSPYALFSFTAPGKPCLVQGVDDPDSPPNSDYKHVIMLMRLPN